jgi:hypothetical protein
MDYRLTMGDCSAGRDFLGSVEWGGGVNANGDAVGWRFRNSDHGRALAGDAVRSSQALRRAGPLHRHRTNRSNSVKLMADVSQNRSWRVGDDSSRTSCA